MKIKNAINVLNIPEPSAIMDSIKGGLRKMDNEQLLESIGLMFQENNKRFDIIDKRFDTMEKQLYGLNQDVQSVKLTIEHDIKGAISAIAEGHKGLAEKLSRIDKMADDIDEIKGAIVAVEAVTANNWNNIIELKKAKA